MFVVGRYSCAWLCSLYRCTQTFGGAGPRGRHYLRFLFLRALGCVRRILRGWKRRANDVSISVEPPPGQRVILKRLILRGWNWRSRQVSYLFFSRRLFFFVRGISAILSWVQGISVLSAVCWPCLYFGGIRLSLHRQQNTTMYHCLLVPHSRRNGSGSISEVGGWEI